MSNIIDYREIEKSIRNASCTNVEVKISYDDRFNDEFDFFDFTNDNLKQLLEKRKEIAKRYLETTDSENKDYLIDMFILVNNQIITMLGFYVPSSNENVVDFLAEQKYDKETTVQLIENRIKTEYKKYSRLENMEWVKIAAHKLYSGLFNNKKK